MIEDKQSNYKQKVSFMSDRCFRMLVCGPSGSGKPMVTFFRISSIDCCILTRYIYMLKVCNRASIYQYLINLFEPIREEAGYPITEASNDKIIPLDKIPCDHQKLVIFL